MTSKISSQEPIHSGHFMTSNPHSDELLPDEEVVEVEMADDVVERMRDDEQKDQNLGDLNVQDEKPVTFYKFGPKKTQSIAIDVSLNKLNKCIKVAYNKMTTPKWKDFKGLRLHWKQRIRLNNVIWRAYYMEFRRPDKDKSKRTPYCYFSVPDGDATHARFEQYQGAVMEGMYWKRGLDALKAQYKRWRHFKARRRGRRRGMSWSQDTSSKLQLAIQNQMPKNLSAEHSDPDDLENEFTDTLFANLMQPYTFPNPKEMTQGCNADVMQPGLLSLQPSIEEIMASFDPPEQLPAAVENVNAPNVSTQPPYTAKEYETSFNAYTSNPTQQPTRQPSTISPQILLASSSAPTYSQAAYEHTPLIATVPYTTNSPNQDYVPQFLTNAMPSSSSVLSSRAWWMNFPSTPTPSLLSSPSTPSIVHSPSSSNTAAASPLSVNSPTTVSLLSVAETHRSSTPSKGALKAYPSSADPLKLQTDRWNVAGPSCLSPRGAEKLDVLTGCSLERGVWKQLSPSANHVGLHPLPIPQPLYPQVSSQIMPTMSPPPTKRSAVVTTGQSSVKQEQDKDDRSHRFPKYTECSSLLRRKCRTVAADSTIEPVERKRILHLNAEQNRRCALKDGFEQLLNLLPNLYGGGTKPTNAVVLARAAERIRELKSNITREEDKAKQLEQHVQRLNDKITSLQASLPSSSRTIATSINQKAEMEQFLERYTKERTRQDYRFWIMAKMMQPLMETLIERLSQLPTDSAVAGTGEWLRTHWQPSVMRPNASSMLVYLATHTGMLSDPNGLQEHIQRELSRQ